MTTPTATELSRLIKEKIAAARETLAEIEALTKKATPADQAGVSGVSVEDTHQSNHTTSRPIK